MFPLGCQMDICPLTAYLWMFSSSSFLALILYKSFNLFSHCLLFWSFSRSTSPSLYACPVKPLSTSSSHLFLGLSYSPTQQFPLQNLLRHSLIIYTHHMVQPFSFLAFIILTTSVSSIRALSLWFNLFSISHSHSVSVKRFFLTLCIQIC